MEIANIGNSIKLIKDHPKFIIVEGIDGSGKTTVVNYLTEVLKQLGLDVVIGKGLGQGVIGSAVRERFFSENKPTPTLEIYGSLAALVDCYESFVVPNLAKNKIVILDRFYPSFFAYQGVGRDNSSMVKQLIEKAFTHRHCYKGPNLSIYCKIDAATARERTMLRGDENYLDKESNVFKTKTSRGFDSIFKSDKFLNPYELDTTETKASVITQINTMVSELFINKDFYCNGKHQSRNT